MSATRYGSRRARHRAHNLLTAQKLSATTWLVTGGELGHGVTANNGTFTCDCGNADEATDGMCSHILAVWLALKGDFDKRHRTQTHSN